MTLGRQTPKALLLSGLFTALSLTLPNIASSQPLSKLKSLKQHHNQIIMHTTLNQKVVLQLLASDIIRLQAGIDGQLIKVADEKAKIVPDSKYPNVEYQLSQQADYQLLQTDKIALRIYADPLRFEVYKADNQQLIFKELKPIELNPKHSVQTLSSHPNLAYYGGGQQNGQFEFNGKTMEISYSGGWEEGDRPSPAPFYMTNQGYGVLRNTWSNGQYDFRSDDYLTASHQEQRFDAYYFFADNINQVLKSYTKISGRAPLLPRWALEYGDADCYNDGDNIKKPGTVPQGWSDGPTGTTPDVITTVAAKYREHDMPGGWILPNDGYGCGYTDLAKVVEGLAQYGFRTGLWTEDGVDKIAWEVGTAGSRAQKLDVAWTGKGYQFALDANYDAATGILNNSDSRPFLWTVMGWAGIQRYAVTWTGDQSGSWDYIRWHIPTLIGSGLSGQVYATGDVDGIFGGSAETYTRDLQFKSFTPVLMGMSGWSKASRKHPWWFDEPYRSINRKYLKLKMRLTPYMYTLAREAEQTGAPLVRGLNWDHPLDPNANNENIKYQFKLGEDFLVAPVYKSQSTSKGWRENIYLPQGQWIDYWDGRITKAPAEGVELDYPVTLDKMPIFVRAGAIIPMYPEALYDGQVAKDVLTLDIYPHGDNQYTLYEDDGNTREYLQGQFSQQQFKVSAPKNKLGDISINIGAVSGHFTAMEQQRVYQLMVHTRAKPSQVLVNGSVHDQWHYDADNRYGTVNITLGSQTNKIDVTQAQTIKIEFDSNTPITETPAYPAMPDYGTALAMDSFKLISRPLEEPGYEYEKAIDDDANTWFRTSRDQSLSLGAHEFVLYLGDRTAISGFDITGRTDKWWKYGQAKDYEIYMSDINGQWGKPAHTGTLAHQEKQQQIRFDPIVGRLLRFRVTSLHDPAQADEAEAAKEQTEQQTNSPYNAMLPKKIDSMSISQFTLHGPELPDEQKQKTYLSDKSWHQVNIDNKHISKNQTLSQQKMAMNGLNFNKGLAVKGNSQIDYKLQGNWQLFRADVGIDDSCNNQDGINFQVWGDEQLLFDSGTIVKPAVVKPEIDIRGIKTLSLRTEDQQKIGCGNWANPVIIGFSSDKVLM